MNTTVPMADGTWGKKDPLLGWTNNPGVHRSTEPGNFNMTFWSNGERASGPIEPPFDDPRPRILLVGDSWAQAYGVADNETFNWRLQERHPELHIENFGTGGYGMAQTWMMLKRQLEIVPTSPRLIFFLSTPFMVDRDKPSFERLQSLRTLNNDVYFPPFVHKNSNGVFEISSPSSTKPWPFEQQSALLTFIHDAAIRVELALQSEPTEASEISLHYIDESKLLADKYRSKFVFVWLLKGPFFKKFEDHFKEMNITSIDCEHPRGFIDELRNGPAGHPNGEYHRFISDCIENQVQQTYQD